MTSTDFATIHQRLTDLAALTAIVHRLADSLVNDISDLNPDEMPDQVRDQLATVLETTDTINASNARYADNLTEDITLLSTAWENRA